MTAYPPPPPHLTPNHPTPTAPHPQPPHPHCTSPPTTPPPLHLTPNHPTPTAPHPQPPHPHRTSPPTTPPPLHLTPTHPPHASCPAHHLRLVHIEGLQWFWYVEQGLLQCFVVPVNAGGQPPKVALLGHETQPPPLSVQRHEGTKESKGQHLRWGGVGRGGEGWLRWECRGKSRVWKGGRVESGVWGESGMVNSIHNSKLVTHISNDC